MKYIYTSQKCSACINLKEQYDKLGVKYTERDASRLKNPVSPDKVDIDAFVILSRQNMELPVEVDVEE